jgi:2-desacetyl-2-hydroxyethyl bacteriochlorophyllide A dehydrogenase
MLAGVYRGPSNFSVEDYKLQSLQNNEVLVKVAYCGVCGTDIHIFQGNVPAKPPVITGHEFAGEVVEVGNKEIEYKIGDKVAINPNIHCGHCTFCKRGKINLCNNLIALGVTANGGFAEYSIIPLSQLYRLPRDFPLNTASFCEPLSCCVHGINQARIDLGDKVGIVGAGPIGLLMVQLSQIAGASEIIVIEPMLERRKMAEKIGASYSIDCSDENLSSMTDAFGGIDVFIECVGKKEAVKIAIELVKPGGKVVVFGLADSSEIIPLNLQNIFLKELTITSSLLNPYTFQTAVNLLVSGKVKVNDFNICDVKLKTPDLISVLSGDRDPLVTKYMVSPIS